MTSRTALENRPDVLWRRVAPLWERAEEGVPLTPGQAEALIEAFFRIGVHPGTDPVTALTLLSRAHRLDAANPKHPYHVGLLYLRHGRAEAAVRWLTAAAALSPVNHRIWAHLSLAYKRLDKLRQGTQDYKGEHGRRAEEITGTIREGGHAFDPDAEHSALPLLRPGECRWSGIHDMTADGRLRGNTSARTRDTLHAELAEIAGLAGRRRGGTAAFTVLATQWLVYGYPVATVRRLAERLPPDDGPATRLLHLVCELFETDPGALPARLTDCLAARSLPDVLIALIHRQRLLWRPLRFPDLGGHAAARAFTDGDPDRHVKAMGAAWRTLAAAPPQPLEDVPDEPAPAAAPPTAGPDARLAELEEAATGLGALRDDAQSHAKHLASQALTDEADFATISGDQELLTHLLGRLETLRLEWLEDLQRFQSTEPSGLVMPFDAFQRRLTDCEAEFQEPLGGVRTVLKRRVEGRLKKRRQEFSTVAPAPSPQARELDDRLTALEARRSRGIQEPGADAPPPEGPDERLADFEQGADDLGALLEEALDRAKELSKEPVTDEAAYARTLGDHGSLTELATRWENVRLALLEELQRFRDAEPAGLLMPFEEYQKRLENCQGRLQQSPGSLRKVLDKRVRVRLAAKEREFATVGPDPSPRARAFEERLAVLERRTTPPPSPTAPARPPSAPARPAQPPPAPPHATAAEQVAHALAVAEQALDANFAEARQTLDAYPAALRHREAVALLRAYVDGHQAEAELRLGRTTAARRRWNAMLTDDPLHTSVLRNLAVAHTSAGDLGPAAQAWQRHVEALYLRDLLHGDIRRGAAERAQVHRVLAGSFGTAPLCRGLGPGGEQDEDTRQLTPVLAGRGKVTVATAHLRLEELNHLVSHHSPSLLLGVDRSAGEPETTAALQRRTAFVSTAVQVLPARVRDPFEKLCLRLLEQAHQDVSGGKGRARRPDDETEEQAHLLWARGRVLWKVAVRDAVTAPEADWAMTEYSGDVIDNLRLIDDLPVDPTDDLVARTIRQLGSRDDPAVFAKRLNELSELAANFAITRIIEAAEEKTGADAQEFPVRFRRVARSWARSSVPDLYTDLLDDPRQLYQPSARTAFGILQESGEPANDRERDIVAAAVTGMRRWTDRLPGATGPARALARLLGSLGRHDEMAEVLTRAREEAFSERGRQHLALEFVQLDIARGRLAEAARETRALLAARPDDEPLRGLLTQVYNRWIQADADLPDPAWITRDFARWTDPEIVRNRRILEVNAALARHGARPEGSGVARLVQDLSAIREADPEHVEALRQLAHARLAQARELREQIRGVAGKRRKELRGLYDHVHAECLRCAEEVLPLVEGEQREGILAILRQIRPDRS
ncbi:hypothetical protein [Streptomyces lincolnensis]|uniref:hypothetical protein n=1 Tax=Streptomyces lincolnensis TaxID=1915 RepID=UPI0015FE4A8B|nr:hypothetical protein [Streptomyces lincolnensis]QMV04971.1 hypothetical protein GJU35_04410 [Streptomyces lincolnensis]